MPCRVDNADGGRFSNGGDEVRRKFEGCNEFPFHLVGFGSITCRKIVNNLFILRSLYREWFGDNFFSGSVDLFSGGVHARDALVLWEPF